MTSSCHVCRLSRTLYDLESRSDAVTRHCSLILEENNRELQSAVQLVTELTGVVKFLKRKEKEQENMIAELKMDKRAMRHRLDAALGEIYKQTGNSTFTLSERFLITPRSASSESRVHRQSFGNVTFSTDLI